METLVLRNDEKTAGEILQLDPKGIIFSPGPCRPSESGYMPALLTEFIGKIPILGVCLGHQAIGEFFGAKLIKATIPMHGKTSEVIHTGHEMFRDIPSPFRAMRYHSLILTEMENTPLTVTAQTNTGEVMAIAHPVMPVWGVQFHPESVLTIEGLQFISNWKRKTEEFYA